MEIKKNLMEIRASLPGNVVLVAVSKTKTPAEIMEAYHAGQRIFGENKIQEMTEKRLELPNDIEWHMIGHVQRNKIKYMAEYVTLVHGIDSFKLLSEIDKQAKKHHRTIPCLLQIHIAEEATKFGLSEDELWDIVNSGEVVLLRNIRIAGLMGMATFTDDTGQVRREFHYLRTLFKRLQSRMPGISVLSMGMSGDYMTAIEEGSNMVRIGSSIFGDRIQEK